MVAETKLTVADLADDLRPVILRLSRELRRESGQSGLSPLDGMLLASIKHTPGMGVSELAELERMSTATMSVHVKRLEEAGWVSREEASEDKRRINLTITREGEKVLDAVRRGRNDWLAERLAELSERERGVLSCAVPSLARIAGDKV